MTDGPAPCAAAGPPYFCARTRQGLLSLLRALLIEAPYSQHRAWLAARPDCQQAVADVVLQWCLPGAAADLEAEQPARFDTPECAVRQAQLVAEVLRAPTLAPALELLRDAGALAAVQSAVAIVEALPTTRPSGADARLFREVQACAAALVFHCCRGLNNQLLSLAELAAWGGASSTMAPPTQLANCSMHLQQAAWRIVALVPKLAAAIQVLAEDLEAAATTSSDPGTWASWLEATCGSVDRVLQLLAALGGQRASPEQLASWAAAATAGLGLRHTLLQVDARHQQGGMWAGDAAGHLSADMMQYLYPAAPVTSLSCPARRSGKICSRPAQMAPATPWQGSCGSCTPRQHGCATSLPTVAAQSCRGGGKSAPQRAGATSWLGWGCCTTSRGFSCTPGWMCSAAQTNATLALRGELDGRVCCSSCSAVHHWPCGPSVLAAPFPCCCRRAANALHGLSAVHAQAVVAVVAAGDLEAAAGRAEPKWAFGKKLALVTAAVSGATRANIAMDPSLEAALEAAMAHMHVQQVRPAELSSSACCAGGAA